jgi:hypothetical protein
LTNEWDDATEEEEEEDLGPGSADYDLSEEHGYMWEQARPSVFPRWLVVAISLLLVSALIVPSLYIVWRFS